jgi:serralysin
MKPKIYSMVSLCQLAAAITLSAANAKTLHVSTSGKDSNSGSLTAPFRTIKKATSANLAPGDVILVQPGIYNESVNLRDSGSASAPITLKSEVQGGAKIRASGAYGVFVTGNYTVVDGFEVSNASMSGISGNEVHHFNVVNNTSHNNGSSGVYCGKCDFVTVDGNHIYENARDAVTSGISMHFGKNHTGSQSQEFRFRIRNNYLFSSKTISRIETEDPESEFLIVSM